jgi:hypothetical protein
VVIEDDGSIRSAGSIESALGIDKDLEEAVEEDVKEAQKAEEPAEEKVEEKKAAVKLIKDEEKSEGRISRKALFSFFRCVQSCAACIH